MSKMMLVSDYDGTFDPTGYKPSPIKYNIEGIRKLKENGHLFTIATGRSYESIIEEINTYQIPYDYLICNDGSALFDNKGSLLTAYYFSQEELEIIINYLETQVYLDMISYFNTYGITNSSNDIIELKIKRRTLVLFSKLVSALKKILPSLSYEHDLINLYIRKSVSKGSTVKELISQTNILPSSVYTVGNDINDLSMLDADFNGHYLPFSNPCLYFTKAKPIISVHDLVNKMLKKEKSIR